MNFASIQISVIAFVPALVLCYYVYRKDRVEKEPLRLLALLFAAGMLAYIPAVYGEHFLIGKIDNMFAAQMQYSLEGVLQFQTTKAMWAHHALCAFAGTALVEETIKWALLLLLTYKNDEFDCLFDGIVYATFVSLGFAAVENIRYALLDGWDTLVLRTVTSVPGHLVFGVFMGCCYTMWRMHVQERNKGISALWLMLSYVLPIVVHGIYSFTNSQISETMNKVFYAFIILMYVLCFICVNYMSERDSKIR